MTESAAALLGTTPSATVGPYLSIGMTWDDGTEVATDSDDIFTLVGTIYDGNGDIVPDGMVEIWHADPDGRFDHPDDPRGARAYPGFRGFGRCATDETGSYCFHTLKPGSLPAADGLTQAPHIDMSVFARGMLNRLVTRIYFPDESAANEADPLLASLDSELAERLIAQVGDDGALHFDVRLQGQGETPFFSI